MMAGGIPGLFFYRVLTFSAQCDVNGSTMGAVHNAESLSGGPSAMKHAIRVTSCVLVLLGVTVPGHAQERINPGQFLAVDFDIEPTAWAGQPEVYDPNLIFLEFRGGVTFSHNAVVTATLSIDGVELASTLDDDSCSLCSSTSWQFAAPDFPAVPIFPTPTIIDFTPVLAGTTGRITLTVESGFMEFAYPPYTENSPVVVFDNIASCGAGCTAFRGVTIQPENLTYVVTSVGRAR